MSKFLNFESFLNESKKDIQFFFDMDGVLADFDKGIEEDKRYDEVKEAKKELFDYIQKEHPEVKHMTTIDDVKIFLPKGNAELKELYDTVHDLIHEIADQKGFFINLKPMDGAEDMLKAAQETSGKLPNILTAPVDSEWCADEKREWMTKHFNGLFDKMYVDKKKEKYATSKNDVLIDDRKKYVTAFTNGGGSAIMHSDPTSTIEQMKMMTR
jgi:5'(3')-deoxyribonucleotidase